MDYFDTCYIVLSQYGIERMTKRRGAVKAGEVALKIAINIPEDAFEEPEPCAVIHTSGQMLIGPDVQIEQIEAT